MCSSAFVCPSSIKDAKQRKLRMWHDVTWEMTGGFSKSSEHNWSVLILASTQQKHTKARAVSLPQAFFSFNFSLITKHLHTILETEAKLQFTKSSAEILLHKQIPWNRRRQRMEIAFGCCLCFWYSPRDKEAEQFKDHFKLCKLVVISRGP